MAGQIIELYDSVLAALQICSMSTLVVSQSPNFSVYVTVGLYKASYFSLEREKFYVRRMTTWEARQCIINESALAHAIIPLT